MKRSSRSGAVWKRKERLPGKKAGIDYGFPKIGLIISRRIDVSRCTGMKRRYID